MKDVIAWEYFIPRLKSLQFNFGFYISLFVDYHHYLLHFLLSKVKVRFNDFVFPFSVDYYLLDY
jgi:hypothetical protein